MRPTANRTGLPRQTARICLVAAFLLASGHVQAQQLKLAQDGEVVRVSADEPNLIEAEQGRITAFVFAEDAFEETSDHEAGVVYFLPREAAPRSGFVEVEDDSGQRSRFSLVLVPVQGWPSQRVVLASGGIRASSQSDGMMQQDGGLPVTRRVSAVKGIMRELVRAAHDFDNAAAVRDSASRTLPGDLRLTVLAKKVDGALHGQVALLENLSARQAVISERMLLIDKEVVAVAVTRQTLAVGEAQIVYMVRMMPRAESDGRENF